MFVLCSSLDFGVKIAIKNLRLENALIFSNDFLFFFLPKFIPICFPQSQPSLDIERDCKVKEVLAFKSREGPSEIRQ